MKKLNIGMIGAGQIATNHCRNVNRHPRAEMVAVADPSEKRARALQKEFGMAGRYKDGEELLEDKEIDAVCIATPNVFHAPLAKAALQAGKHVMLDKPFAMNAKEAKEVVTLAKKKRRILTLGMNWRFMPDPQTMKALVARGELGEIYHARTAIFRRSGIPSFGTWFSQKKLSGGGALLDIGVHFLDVCLYIMGNFDAVAVSGATYRKFGHRGLGEGGWGMSDKGKHVFDVDDFATALIKFKNGATVNLDVSWAIHMPEAGKANIEIFGDKAGLQLSPLRLCRYGKKKGEYEVVEPQNVKPVVPYDDRFINWLDAILKKTKPICTLDEALMVQKLLDAIYKSSETGKEVRIR